MIRELMKSPAALLPLLALYTAVVLLGARPEFGGDEGGYVENAKRMLFGPPVTPEDLRLWWGPGYPMTLAPFAALGLPWILAKLLNAAFLFGAILFFRATVARHIGAGAATVTALILGVYPPFLRELPFLTSESLTVFAICGFMYHFSEANAGGSGSRWHAVPAAAFLAYLALTKVFFGYVITASLLLALALFAVTRKRALSRASSICTLALVLCLPYLAYTYSLTGKLFYWGTSGGMSLYFMSTPYPNEFGSWFSAKDVRERSELAPHRDFFASIEGLTDVERDEAFKHKAIENIRRYPVKYLTNIAANIGRLLFSYPFSFGPHSMSTFFYLVPNMFLVVLAVLSVTPALLRPREIPFEIWALLVFALIAFGGSTLLSAYDRQFRPLAPALFLWLAYIAARVIRIELRPGSRMSRLMTSHA
jgi:hypothetical protein